VDLSGISGKTGNPGTQYRFLHCLLDGGAGLAGLGISNMSPELSGFTMVLRQSAGARETVKTALEDRL